MAIVDPWYRFTCVDIGDYGSNANGAIWSRSAFGQALEHGELDLPLPINMKNGMKLVIKVNSQPDKTNQWSLHCTLPRDK